MSAFVVSSTSHLVPKHFRASKVILLINLLAIMQLVDFQVGDGDPFAQLLAIQNTTKSEHHG